MNLEDPTSLTTECPLRSQKWGIEVQKTMVREYLKNKYPPKYEFEEKKSGKKATNRPELIKALDICRQENGILIVSNLDRLSRDVNFITLLLEEKTQFVICDMPEATPD